MDEIQNLNAGVTSYDLGLAPNMNPVEAKVINSPLGDGSLAVAQDIQRKSTPQSIDISRPLTGTTSKDSLWNTNTKQKPSFETWNTNLDNAYVKLNDGTYIARFENYMAGTNNEDRLAQQQGALEKWGNGAKKFIAKTGVNVLDATVGSINGLLEGITTGNFNAVYNNDFAKWVDDLNTKLDRRLPNYYTDQEQDFSFSSLGTANFWADKVLGGMSFVAGTVISEALWATATGGASLAVAPERLLAKGALAGVREQNRILHSITALSNAYQRTVPTTRALKAFNNARFLYTSAGYESGVEARHFLKEAEANYFANYEQANGRRPSGEEVQAFRDSSLNTANGVFAANLALVGGSNVAQFGTIFGASSFIPTEGLTRGFNRALGVGVNRTLEAGQDVYRALSPSRVQRILGNTYNVLKSPLREGVIEEGGQSVVSNFGQRWLDAKYNPTSIQENFSSIDALGESLKEVYGTSKGLEEVAIGSIIGFLAPVATSRLSGQTVAQGLGIGAFNAQVQEQVNFAETRTANSDYNLAQKFFNTGAQKTSLQQVAAKEGVAATEDLNLGMFSKFQTDDLMGLLDDSSANFRQVIEQTNIQELAQSLNISEAEATEIKDNALTAHNTALEDYKVAQKYAEAVLPEGENVTLDSKNTFLPKQDVQSLLALNIYMSRNSDRLSRRYAQAISDVVADSGTSSALQIENLLQDKQVNKSREVKKLNRELKQLDASLNQRNNELIKLASQPRSTEGDARLKQFEDRRQVLLAAEERDTARRDEINNELQGIATNLNEVQKARRIANQAFAENLEDGIVTPEKLIETADNLSSLAQTLDNWRNNGQEAAAKNVETLISEFDNSKRAWQNANEAYEKLSDPALRKKEFQSVFGGVIKKARKLGADTSDFSKTQIELFQILARQYDEFKNITTSFQNDNVQQTETVSEQIAGDTLPNVQRTTSAQQEAENEIRKDFEQRRQELVQPETQEIGDESILENDANTYQQELTDLNEQEEQALSAVREQYSQPAQPTTLRERLEAIVEQLTASRRQVEEISTPTPAPTQAEKDEFKKLYERNRRSTNGLKPVDQSRYEELQNKLNNYGRAVGTAEGGVNLADILEQIYTLENAEQVQEVTPIVNNTNTAEIQGILIKSGAGQDTSNKAQYWEKSEFRILPDNNYSITGINLQGLVDIVNTSNNATILYDKIRGQKNNRKQVTGGLQGQDYNVGDKFILKFEQDIEVGVTIGETKNLIINPAGIEVLNERTRFKIIPSTNLPTNFQPLLQELNSNATITPLEVVNTNFELEPGLSFTDFTNRADNTDLSLFVSMRNEYNKDLVQKFRSGKIKFDELQRNMAIYVMSQEGEVGGVLKSLSKNVLEGDDNYSELSQIRNVAVQRAIDGNFENELIDVQISVPLDKNGSYFGKPNFNLILNKETGRLSTELLSLSDKAINKVTDVGYITDKKLYLKDGKNETKINTSFVSRMSLGRTIPIIVFNYNGAKIAYPVSMNEIEVDKVGEFNSLISSSLLLNEKVKILNEYLANNNLDVNQGFYYVAGETNIDNQEQVDRIRTELASQSTYSNFKDWTKASNLEAAKDMVQQQASINIDITDKPFHSPKLGLKLKDKTIIGSVQSPVNRVVEEATNINTSEIIQENTCE